jgi:PRTRC genetic system ThiF family protein
MGEHTIHAALLQRQVRVVVVGCGGAGSALTSGLPYLHQALIVRGHPGGLHVTVLDGEKIAATNCVRQPFSKSEIGLYKSVVLVNRLNVFWELDWQAIPEHLTENQPFTRGYRNRLCRYAGRPVSNSKLRHAFQLGWLLAGHRKQCRQWAVYPG